MNERISIHNDNAVLIDKDKPGDFINVHTRRCSGLLPPQVVIHAGGDVVLDAGSVDAILDILHCWKDTGGSFAALADTSAGIYPGKRMRASNGHEVTIIGPSVLRDHWDFREKRSDGSGFDWTLPADDLLPLVEQPKVQVNAGALGTAIQVLQEYRFSKVDETNFEAAMDARIAEDAIKKVMKRCGIEPTP